MGQGRELDQLAFLFTLWRRGERKPQPCPLPSPLIRIYQSSGLPPPPSQISLPPSPPPPSEMRISALVPALQSTARLTIDQVLASLKQTW